MAKYKRIGYYNGADARYLSTLSQQAIYDYYKQGLGNFKPCWDIEEEEEYELMSDAPYCCVSDINANLEDCFVDIYELIESKQTPQEMLNDLIQQAEKLRDNYNNFKVSPTDFAHFLELVISYKKKL